MAELFRLVLGIGWYRATNWVPQLLEGVVSLVNQLTSSPCLPFLSGPCGCGGLVLVCVCLGLCGAGCIQEWHPLASLESYHAGMPCLLG